VYANHGRIPRHGLKELVEEIGASQIIDHPVIAVTVYDRLVKVKHNDNPSHRMCKRRRRSLDAMQVLCFVRFEDRVGGCVFIGNKMPNEYYAVQSPFFLKTLVSVLSKI